MTLHLVIIQKHDLDHTSTNQWDEFQKSASNTYRDPWHFSGQVHPQGGGEIGVGTIHPPVKVSPGIQGESFGVNSSQTWDITNQSGSNSKPQGLNIQLFIHHGCKKFTTFYRTVRHCHNQVYIFKVHSSLILFVSKRSIRLTHHQYKWFFRCCFLLMSNNTALCIKNASLILNTSANSICWNSLEFSGPIS